MISLSNSTLSLFRECPRCFWLQMNKKVARPRGIFPSLPGGMDLIIKEYYNRYRYGDQLPPLIAGKVEGMLADISLNLKWLDEKEGLRITGKLDDCIELDDGSLVPLDHKTRGSLPKDQGYSQNYYQTQMDTYTLLLQKSGYQTKNEAYIIYYSPCPGELHQGVPFQVEVHRMNTYPEMALQLYQQAKLCLEGEIPDSDVECEFCAWSREAAKY
jgi:hypothetical protein